jgi:Tol biopolymer transport system component
LTTYDPDGGEFVVLLHDMEYEGEQPPLQLYYSATNATQSLPVESPLDQVDPSFAPGGRWLVLYDFSSGEPGSYTELWVRSLASTVAQQLRLFEREETIYYRFAPNGERVAVEVGNYIRIEGVPLSGRAQSQGFGPYDVFPHSWSPDGRYLAITGQDSRDGPPALFVLPVEVTTP